MEPVAPQIEERKSPSFFHQYKFTIISLCIILVALVPLIFLAKNSKKPTPQPVAEITTPTPEAMTPQNAAPTLDAIDTKIQTALDQSNTDLQQSSQVDSSQDSTTGL